MADKEESSSLAWMPSSEIGCSMFLCSLEGIIETFVYNMVGWDSSLLENLRSP